MKLMKHITIALVLCAIPAVAVGQTVGCDDCTHVASVYMGEGGFIATAGEDAEMVTWVATCGGVTRTGKLEPNDDGVVAALWEGDLACMAAGGGDFKLGPVMDGGWFWVTDDTNSAVGGLVSEDVLDNDAAAITSAGDSVKMTKGKGAYYLKHTSGRVGILPNILPEPEMDPVMPTPCGVKGAGTGASNFTVRDTDCEMGDGKAMILATTYNPLTGATDQLMDGGTITRPAGTGTQTITIDLWGNGTGHFIADRTSTGTNGITLARGIGAVGSASAAARAATRLTGVTYTVTGGGGAGGGGTINSGTPFEGVDHAAPGTNGENALNVTVGASSDNCSRTNNYPTPITVSAVVADGATGAEQVIPNIERAATTNVAATLKFTVVCPAASANMGTELVPENPFPTDK
jgi:hypothetical protein